VSISQHYIWVSKISPRNMEWADCQRAVPILSPNGTRRNLDYYAICLGLVRTAASSRPIGEILFGSAHALLQCCNIQCTICCGANIFITRCCIGIAYDEVDLQNRRRADAI
jgi:hypothetical protein